ncbi:MAG: hypothetical protein HYZ58_19795 [Acidobacteria bacterium]|nr:hypothetical protein [Acidobacteriota bacterium]
MSRLLPPAEPGQLHSGQGSIANAVLEEYKLLDQQARFVMTSYMQALALYLALVGIGLREVLQAKGNFRIIVLTSALTCGNVLAVYAARHFRCMAYHALNRQSALAKQLNFQAPYPMLWGYHVGISSFFVVQLGIIAVALRIIFFN